MSEMPQAFNQIERKARKEHKCCECKKIIEKGEVYIYSSGIWDEPMSFKQCKNCAEIMNAACDYYTKTYGWNDSVCFGDLVDFFMGFMCKDYENEPTEFIRDMADLISYDFGKMELFLGRFLVEDVADARI